jgi:hypothetical protein
MNDLIDRQEVIRIIDRNGILGQGLLNDILDHIVERIMQLPPAHPLITCDGCRFVGTYYTDFPCCCCTRRGKDYYEK